MLMITKNWNFCTMWCMNTKIRKRCELVFVKNNTFIAAVFYSWTIIKLLLFSWFKILVTFIDKICHDEYVLRTRWKGATHGLGVRASQSITDDIFRHVYCIHFSCFSVCLFLTRGGYRGGGHSSPLNLEFFVPIFRIASQ